MPLEFLEGFRLVQKKVHLLDCEGLDPEQVLQTLEHCYLLFSPPLGGGLLFFE
jgi:hypothetical protein